MLRSLSGRLEQDAETVEEVGAAIESLVRFLDEYLGSQIIILN